MNRYVNRLSTNIRLIVGAILLLSLFSTLVFTSRTTHATTYTVTNTNDSGPGSLRQALIDTNTNPGHDTINFNIPGPGPHVISPTTNYSAVDNSQLGSGGGLSDNAVTIDGCSQPGSDCSKFPLVLKIQVDGANLGTPPVNGVASIFVPSGQGSTVKGLSITGGKISSYAAFTQLRIAFNGSFIATGGFNLQSNFIGLTPDGTPRGNTSAIALATNGVRVLPNKIGGLGAGQGNVISDNNSGIGTNNSLFSSAATSTDYIVEGNYFGLDPTGTTPIPNDNNAIVLTTTHTDPMTGTRGATIRNNKIYSAGTNGIFMYKAGGVLIENNEIVGSNTGIMIQGSAAVRAAGTTPAVIATPNVIKNNIIRTSVNDGIAFTSTGGVPVQTAIQENSIYDNGGLGIDLLNDGGTVNDAGDADAGPNTLLNHPVLKSASNTTSAITGTYEGAPNATYTVDVYASETADPSGNGEGQRWLGSVNVTTDASGKAFFGPEIATESASRLRITSATLNGNIRDWTTLDSVPAGWVVSSTATDSTGNTSEFSNSVTPSGFNYDAYDVYFEYRVQGSTDPFIKTVDQDFDFPSSYEQALTGLAPGTTYEYRLVLAGEEGIRAGDTRTFTTVADDDSDGISNAVEDAAPNGGDANDDGTLDSAQSHVASYISKVTGKYVVTQVDDTCELSSTSMTPESDNAAQDQAYSYPVGLMNFTADCGTPGFEATVTQHYYAVEGTYIVRKYNSNTDLYFTLDDATVAKTTIEGAAVTKASFTVTDGTDRDIDGVVDGNITDPAGLARLVDDSSAPASDNDGGLADTGVNLPVIAITALALIATGGFVIYRVKRHSAH